jgi:DNA-binding NarL/FixJ family response regulator
MCDRVEEGDPGVMDMRCMIIDDNVAFLHAMRSMIEQDGARVVDMALNGHDAVERAESCRPDVVLIDVRLGAESGYDVAHRIEERAVATDGPPPAIILLSTHPEDELADRIAANPSYGFLDKTTVSLTRVRELLLGWTGRSADWS